jgi:hypothetical protein
MRSSFELTVQMIAGTDADEFDADFPGRSSVAQPRPESNSKMRI